MRTISDFRLPIADWPARLCRGVLIAGLLCAGRCPAAQVNYVPTQTLLSVSNYLWGLIQAGGGGGPTSGVTAAQATNIAVFEATLTGVGSTNFTLTIGLNGTNYATGIGAAATNYATTVGVAATNLAVSLAINGTNYSTSIGTAGTNLATSLAVNGTNYAAGVGLANTNLSTTLAINGTNYATGVGTAATNYAAGVGLANTNLTTTLAINGTNYATGVGTAATNYAAAVGLANTNLTTTLAINGTNYATGVGTSATNYAAAVGLANTNLTTTLAINGTNYATGVGTAATNYAAAVGLANTNLSATLAINGTNYATSVGTAATNFVNAKWTNALANTLTNVGGEYLGVVTTNGNYSIGGTNRVVIETAATNTTINFPYIPGAGAGGGQLLTVVNLGAGSSSIQAGISNAVGNASSSATNQAIAAGASYTFYAAAGGSNWVIFSQPSSGGGGGGGVWPAFDSTQFFTNSSSAVALLSGALTTNLVLHGTVTMDSGNTFHSSGNFFYFDESITLENGGTLQANDLAVGDTHAMLDTTSSGNARLSDGGGSSPANLHITGTLTVDGIATLSGTSAGSGAGTIANLPSGATTTPEYVVITNAVTGHKLAIPGYAIP